MMFVNLLPPSQKEEIQHEKTTVALTVSFVLYAVVFIALAGLLFGIKATLGDQHMTYHEERKVREQFFTSEKNKSIETAIKTTNLLTSTIVSVNTSATRPLPYITAIANATPEGIKLDTLLVDFDAQSARVTGNTTSRDLLLTYITELKKISILSTISSPLSNITTSQNINFTLTMTLIDPSSPHDATQ